MSVYVQRTALNPLCLLVGHEWSWRLAAQQGRKRAVCVNCGREQGA